MEKTATERPPLVAKGNGVATADLSLEIARNIERRPGDRVRVRRVSNNAYRCNWLSVETSAESRFMEMWRIRQSRFLRAVKLGDRLVIEDITGETASSN